MQSHPMLIYANIGTAVIACVLASTLALSAADVAGEVLKVDGGVRAKFAWIRATQREPYQGIDPGLTLLLCLCQVKCSGSEKKEKLYCLLHN